MGHWLIHALGLDNASGTSYLAWSGFGGDIGELAIIAGLASLIRHRNCHVKGCMRIGRHHVEGTSWVVCGRHRPGGAPTHQDVLDAHREHQARHETAKAADREAKSEP